MAQPNLDAAAETALLHLQLSGNVRELENILERAVALSDGGHISCDDLQLTPSGAEQDEAGISLPGAGDTYPLQDYLDRLEREAIVDALEKPPQPVVAAVAGHHLPLDALPHGASGHRVKFCAASLTASQRTEARRGLRSDHDATLRVKTASGQRDCCCTLATTSAGRWPQYGNVQRGKVRTEKEDASATAMFGHSCSGETATPKEDGSALARRFHLVSPHLTVKSGIARVAGAVTCRLADIHSNTVTWPVTGNQKTKGLTRLYVSP